MVVEVELSIVVHSTEPESRQATLKQLFQVQDLEDERRGRTEWEIVHFVLEAIFVATGEKSVELAELFINNLYEMTAH